MHPLTSTCLRQWWRVLSGALGIAECLQAHGLNPVMQCSLCQNDLESLSHVLFLCGPARTVWEISNIPLPSQGFTESLHDNFTFIFALLRNPAVDPKLQLAIPWLLWGIWKHRNEVIHAGKHGDLNILVDHAIEESEIWNKLALEAPAHTVQANRAPRAEVRWLRPPLNVFKCNVHSSWINDTSLCGGSWIVRNHNGDAVFHARDAFLPTSNRIASELRYFLWALQSLQDLHFEYIEIWSDCAAAIEAVTDSLNWPRYHSYLDKISRLIPGFRKVLFKLASPKANSIARDIAKSVTRDGRFRSYLAIGGPAWLHSRIEEDKRR